MGPGRQGHGVVSSCGVCGQGLGTHVRVYMCGGGFGMTPWCDVLVCSWRRLLADRHSLPFPWTLSLHRRWCPSASHLFGLAPYSAGERVCGGGGWMHGRTDKGRDGSEGSDGAEQGLP